MKAMKSGQFYGQTNSIIDWKGITLTDTEYTHDKVDWHYHENAYFTFILEGQLIEGTKKQLYNCSNGSLLFHNWQEAHYNIKPRGFTRGFHIELENKWAQSFDIDLRSLEGSLYLRDPELKILFYRIFKETKISDNTSNLAIQTLLLETLSRMINGDKIFKSRPPSWVFKIKEILHDTSFENWSLILLSKVLDIHPVHLSRDFSKYFGSTLGEYIRNIRVERSLTLLPNSGHSLVDIALNCGFADQSHFTRCFRKKMNITPLLYRKILFS